MKKLKKLLRPDGLVVISTVNTNSFSFTIKREDWRYFIPPEHILYFNQKSMAHLATRYGFDLIYFKTRFQIQAYLTNNKEVQEIRNINIHLYQLKVFLEKMVNPFLFRRGEIITCILKNKS